MRTVPLGPGVMEGPAQWDLLGWQGISLEIPADWCPGRLEGDHTNGYLRVEDEFSVRLELRWEPSGRRLPVAARLVDRYLKETQKRLRRRVGTPKIDRGRCIPQFGTLDHEVFTWRGGFLAHSLLAVCPETRRVVHVRIFFSENDDLKNLTRRVFGSLRTAPTDGLNDWSVFGFRFRLGAAWRLEKSALWAGRPQFLFTCGTDEMEVARVSLAEMVFRKSTLQHWFEGFFAKALRRFRYEIRAGDYRKHPGLVCDGVMRIGARPLDLLRRRRYQTALAWHCATADKLFVVRAVTAVPREPQVPACADSINCHTPSP